VTWIPPSDRPNLSSPARCWCKGVSTVFSVLAAPTVARIDGVGSDFRQVVQTSFDGEQDSAPFVHSPLHILPLPVELNFASTYLLAEYVVNLTKPAIYNNGLEASRKAPPLPTWQGQLNCRDYHRIMIAVGVKHQL
jgi:hypothetical protein